MGRRYDDIFGVIRHTIGYTKEERNRLHELLECMNINVNDEIIQNEYTVNSEYFPEICGYEKDGFCYNYESMHSIINLLFPDSCVFLGNYNCDTISDYYNIKELILDPVKKIKISYNRCEDLGNELIQGIPAYEYLQKDIEKYAEKKNIEPDWIEDEDTGDLSPNEDNEEFYELAENYKDNHYTNCCTDKSKKKYKVPKVDATLLESIKKEAENKNYTKLLDLINSKSSKKTN